MKNTHEFTYKILDYNIIKEMIERKEDKILFDVFVKLKKDKQVPSYTDLKKNLLNQKLTPKIYMLYNGIEDVIGFSVTYEFYDNKEKEQKLVLENMYKSKNYENRAIYDMLLIKILADWSKHNSKKLSELHIYTQDPKITKLLKTIKEKIENMATKPLVKKRGTPFPKEKETEISKKPRKIIKSQRIK